MEIVNRADPATDDEVAALLKTVILVHPAVALINATRSQTIRRNRQWKNTSDRDMDVWLSGLWEFWLRRNLKEYRCKHNRAVTHICQVLQLSKTVIQLLPSANLSLSTRTSIPEAATPPNVLKVLALLRNGRILLGHPTAYLTTNAVARIS